MDDESRDPEQDGDSERDVVAEADAMADALEDELADAVAGPSWSTGLPRPLLLPALLLSAAIALPLTPDGFSFAQLLYAGFLRSPLEALVMLLGFGSPFLFGMIVALTCVLGDRIHPRIVERLLITNLSFLHAQLVLVAYLLWSGGQGMVPWALLGFAVVSGGLFTVSHARAAANGGRVEQDGTLSESGPSLPWLVRWGATVIVAVCGWIRLQVLVDVRLGYAVEVMLAACVAMTVLVVRRHHLEP